MTDYYEYYTYCRHNIREDQKCWQCEEELKAEARKSSLYKLQPIETAPKDGTYILLFGDSGYRTTPLRAAVGHWDAEYRPKNPWRTHSSDAFTDGGDLPTYWMPLPEIPLIKRDSTGKPYSRLPGDMD